MGEDVDTNRTNRAAGAENYVHYLLLSDAKYLNGNDIYIGRKLGGVGALSMTARLDAAFGITAERGSSSTRHKHLSAIELHHE